MQIYQITGIQVDPDYRGDSDKETLAYVQSESPLQDIHRIINERLASKGQNLEEHYTWIDHTQGWVFLGSFDHMYLRIEVLPVTFNTLLV